MYENRINQLRRDTDTVRNICIKIEDVDEAILRHIKNTIKPEIVENNKSTTVPCYFANPERWKSIQADGWFRDENTKQILVPVLVISRGDIAKSSTMTMDKMDGNLRRTISSGYDTKNRYDIFSLANKLSPSKVHYSVTVPDYVNVNYEVKIWTAYIRQMNSIIEKFVYAEGSYWGDKYYKFRANYDNINNVIEVTDNDNRSVTDTFTMNVNAYIIPESFNNRDTTIKILSPAKIIIQSEFVKNINSIILNNK